MSALLPPLPDERNYNALLAWDPTRPGMRKERVRAFLETLQQAGWQRQLNGGRLWTGLVRARTPDVADHAAWAFILQNLHDAGFPQPPPATLIVGRDMHRIGSLRGFPAGPHELRIVKL